MLSKPKWFKMLRYECQPQNDKVKKLEALRNQFNIPHESFFLRVLSSPSSTRHLQQHVLEQERAQMPNADEKELWEGVLFSRMTSLVVGGFESPDIIEEIDDVIRESSSFDDICDYIIGLDQKYGSFPETFGIGEMIDKILEE